MVSSSSHAENPLVSRGGSGVEHRLWDQEDLETVTATAFGFLE